MLFRSQAHREHYYQRLVQCGWGHRRTLAAECALMLAVASLALSGLSEATVLTLTAALYAARAGLAPLGPVHLVTDLSCPNKSRMENACSNSSARQNRVPRRGTTNRSRHVAGSSASLPEYATLSINLPGAPQQ